MTAVAVAAITATTLAGYIATSGHNRQSAGLALADALQPAGHAMDVLEADRQQLIVMDSAAHTMHLVGSPKLASRAAPGGSSGATGSTGAGNTGPSGPPPNPTAAQQMAMNIMPSFGFSVSTQFSCLNNIWTRESNWNYKAENASGAYGIPQALPGSKMASAGADWATNPATQIRWGLGYIQSTYGTPCSAWVFWQGHSYY
ncbi:MAG TPA: lytic transglycosylase domain-containing protein [Streptosporangiaceae bacterium]|nr:lytic transglycosylase domain-containing protein [Streptosporangiaceae bacterium]